MPEPEESLGKPRLLSVSVPTVWLLSRGIVLLLLVAAELRAVGDVVYFSDALRDLSPAGLDTTLREYPLAALAVVWLPWMLARVLGSTQLYGFAFVLGGLLADAAFTYVLSRFAPRRRGAALTVWLVSVPAMGGLSYVRFDLLPGVLVGCLILLHGTRPRLAALVVAVATSVKLWPALLIPPVVMGRRQWRSTSMVVGAVGGSTVLLTVLLAGWSRVFSPLTYQADRGLQIESVPATPLMVGRALHVAGYDVSFSRYMAYEITGPATTAMMLVTTLLTLAFVAFLILVWARMLRRDGRVGGDAFVWTCLAVTLGFMCSGKVLSPQYFLWLLPMSAAGLAVVTTTSAQLLRWTGGLLVATLLSHAIFPWLYDSLLAEGPASDVAVVVLLLRNVLTLGLFWVAARRTLRLTAAQPASDGTGTGSWRRERQARSSSTVRGTAAQGASMTSEPT